LLLLITSLAIDALFGGMTAIFRHVPHPIVLAGRGIPFFDRKLNRETRGEVSRRDRSIITVMLLVGGAAALGLVIERLCRGRLLGAAVEAPLIAVVIDQRTLYEHVAAVAQALDSGGLAGAARRYDILSAATR
jgi:adenosylcobinamide-phosphate synthase